MISGISATQVVQLVAQKFTKVTLPFICSVENDLPSSKTIVEAGAGPVKSDTLVQPASINAAAASVDREKAVAKRREADARYIGFNLLGLYYETSSV